MEKLIKILLVEDLPSDAQLAEYEIAKTLTRYMLKIVETREAFIDALLKFTPDIVISDFQLPSFDGLSALKLTMEYSKITPVIILTGSMNEDTAVDCMKAGASDYVIKEHIKRLGSAILSSLKTRDILIKKIESQKSLQESEEKFRSIFENHSAVKLIIDAESGEIVEANSAAESFYGWSADELKNMKIYQINTLPESDIKQLLEATKNSKNLHFEFVHRKADGTKCDVEVFSSKVKIAGKNYLHSIVHDVSQKKRAEERLRLLSRSVEQSPVSVMIMDKYGKIEYVNPTFTKITEYMPEEVIGREPTMIKWGFLNDKHYDNIWNTVKSGNDWEGEFCNKKKSGEIIWEKAIISPIFNDLGDITHYIEIKEDITEKKVMIEDLVKAKELAEESERLKSAFLQNMSHEIRTPMNGILGFLEILREPQLSGDEREKYFEIVNRSARRLLSSINNILEISKIETNTMSLQISDVNTEDMLNYFYGFFRPMAQDKGLDLICKPSVTGNESIILTDRYKIESIISNLINNAIKFTYRGYIEFGSHLDGDDIVFYVKDSGIGIPEERIEAVFDRFVQEDMKVTRPHEGVGLGLSIVKAYCNALNGSITVDSKYGEGSRFVVRVPITQERIS